MTTFGRLTTGVSRPPLGRRSATAIWPLSDRTQRRLIRNANGRKANGRGLCCLLGRFNAFARVFSHVSGGVSGFGEVLSGWLDIRSKGKLLGGHFPRDDDRISTKILVARSSNLVVSALICSVRAVSSLVDWYSATKRTVPFAVASTLLGNRGTLRSHTS
jgi:hypothetical protein